MELGHTFTVAQNAVNHNDGSEVVERHKVEYQRSYEHGTYPDQ